MFNFFLFWNNFRVTKVAKINKLVLSMYLSPASPVMTSYLTIVHYLISVNNLKQQLPEYEPNLEILKINAFFQL